MANIIILCIIGLILMVFSKEPIISIIGIMIILFIFSRPLFFIVLIVGIFVVIYYCIKETENINKVETKYENNLNYTKKEIKKDIYFEYQKAGDKKIEKQKIYRKKQLSNNEIIEKIVNCELILGEYIRLCISFYKDEELINENLKIEEALVKTITKIYNKYEYEIQRTDLDIYNKKSHMNQFFGQDYIIKEILESCFNKQFNNLKESNIFIEKIIKEINFCDIFKVSNIIRTYTSNYPIWSEEERNSNLYILIYFCSYIFASCLYENTYVKTKENEYIIEYDQYMKLKKEDKEKTVKRKDVIIVFNIEESKFENKTVNDKLKYLIEKANKVRIQLKMSEKREFITEENKLYEAIKYISQREIINIIINSLKNYNINIEKNNELVIMNMISIFDKIEELKKREIDKFEERKRKLKEKQRIEQEKKIEKEREKKLEAKRKLENERKLKKEKIEQEKLKQEELKKRKIEETKQSLAMKLENEKEQINNKLLDIFENISLFITHNENIISLNKNSNLYMTMLKRIILEISQDFNSNKVKKLKVELKKNILEEFIEKKELCIFIYDEIIEVLEYNLIVNEVDNFKNTKELFKIYTSLINVIEDEEYITNKIYTMYKNFYANTFTKKMSKKDLEEIIKIMIKQSKYERYRENFFGENANAISMLPYINEKTLIKFIKVIENTNYFNKVNQIEKEEMYFVINSLLNKVSNEEKIFVLENISKIYEKLKKDLQKRKLLEEKQRLLNGDMSKEIEMQKQSVEYSNIQNGYEFEEYVANLYRKLGYTIDEITKKSGDQQCRCNCI